MKVAVVGMGAMGTLLAHGMARGGHTVTVLDRRRRVEQIRSDGLVVVATDGTESRAEVAMAIEDAEAGGVHDAVFLATKAHQVPEVAPHLGSLMSADSSVVTIQNGIPWWYFHRYAGDLCGCRLLSLDPSGAIERSIDSRRVVGCVAYPAAHIDADGRAHHVEGTSLPVGELDGSELPRTRQLVDLLTSAGFKSRILGDIRSEIWLKAWGALSLNPVSALTRATMEEICIDKLTRDLVATMMQEAQTVAEALGVTFRHTIDKRIEGARLVGRHKTSMLQDLERGEPLELDALLGSVIELGGMIGRDTPTLRAVYACTALLDKLNRSGHVDQRRE